MGKSLVIVESPAKARTINKYLGKDFVVKSSVGHIRDLPTSGSASTKSNITPKERAKLAVEARKLPPKQREKRKRERAKIALVKRMGIDPENGWKPRYEIVPGKEKVVSELQKLAKNADAVYLATDLDREGEAIAWHLKEAIGGKDTDFKRVVFNEITKKAIQSAFAKPGILDQDQVDAQQTRRFLDRVVGYMVSPLLWKKIARGLSAGRVQSVAVKLVVEREREINAFDPEEYWEIHCDLNKKSADPFTVQVMKYDGGHFRPTNKDQSDTAVGRLENAQYLVDKITTKPSSSKPRAPFITSTLQQAASTRLGFGVKKTMMLAQRLYEGGYITYMRTDSTNLSAEAVQDCRSYIENKYGKQYLPEAPIQYANSEGAQAAHEAVRPSNVETMLSDVKGVDKDAVRLYELIWRQFVACQMPPAKFNVTTLSISADKYELHTKGRVVIFDGWTRVQPPQTKKDDEATLPAVEVGDKLNLIQLNPSQHFTKPPPRYTEASLVKELEKRGIGRPSTYASIISTIQDRGYVTVDRRRFHAEKIGEIVSDRLSESFTDLMDYGFTADMEKKLDAIASGKKDWRDTLDAFYKDFQTKLIAADDDENGMRGNDPVVTDISCPKCERPMTIRIGSTGVFLGCSGYALPPKERCKSTVNLIPGEEAESIDESDDSDLAEVKNLMDKHRCPKCSAAMNHFLIDEERKIHICSKSPDCEGIEIEQGQFRIKGYEGPELECDKCGQNMELKSGRFGKYFGCSNEECKNTRKLLRNGEAAPPKADPIHMPELPCEKTEGYFILRDGAAGIFLASSAFPKSRETRAPFVQEIIPHRAELDPKYTFLADAPTEDDRGNPSKIRFSRKNKEQYVMSEIEGKATGWTAHFQEGSWVENIAVKKKKKAAKKKTIKKKKTSVAKKKAKTAKKKKAT